MIAARARDFVMNLADHAAGQASLPWQPSTRPHRPNPRPRWLYKVAE